MSIINIAGDTSGNVSIVFPAVSGTTIIDLPANSGDIITLTDLTGAISLPAGTTAQRPSIPLAGMIRMNTTTGNTEYYNGSSWNNFNA